MPASVASGSEAKALHIEFTRLAFTHLALLACTVSLAGLACTETIDVLDLRPELPPQSGDASILREPDDFNPIEQDAAALESPCATCPAGELCAVDACVPAFAITSLSGSHRHNCEVTGGRLFCWGENGAGQLGVGDRTQRAGRTRVGTWNDWLSVATGEAYSCAIRAPGQLFCWGDNATGQLGQGDTRPRTFPTPIESDVLFRSISCGGTSACAIDEEHRLHCWGDNLEGKPGQADPYSSPDITRPALVGGEGDARYAQVAVGQGHVCAIDEARALSCWGRNTDGALGIGLDPPQTRTPMRVGTEADWVDIAGSQHSTCGVRGDGSLWCWGKNKFFELARPELETVYSEPTQVGTDLNWSDVSTGWFHTCAIRSTGELKCWGRAIEGQLGQGGGVDPVQAPVSVTGSNTWAQITTGNLHTCGVTSSDELMCWGAADGGQLGLGDDERRFEPTPVP